MLQNEYLVAKIGVDTAENEPSKVCQMLPNFEMTLEAQLAPNARRS